MPEGLDSAALEISSVATQAASSAWLWGGNFLILIVLTVVILFFAMHQGASGLIALNLAVYAAYALYIVLPYRDAIIGIGTTPLIQAILSIGLFIGLMVLPFVLLLRLTAPSFGQLSIFQNLLLSFAAAVFATALAYHVFEISDIYNFSEPLNGLFAPEGYFFYWFITPLVSLYFLAR
jgi:hypothetical protein